MGVPSRIVAIRSDTEALPGPSSLHKARDAAGVRPTIGGGGAVVVVPRSIAETHDIGGGGLVCVVYPDNATGQEIAAFIWQANLIKQKDNEAIRERFNR